MRKITAVVALLVLAAGAFALFGPSVSAQSGGSVFTARLQGFNEVPAISTTGEGNFRARILGDRQAIRYVLSYSDLDSTAFAAHIHIGQRDVNGGVIAFLCGGGDKPPCPPSGTVRGTIDAADVVGPDSQGIEPGSFGEVVRAIRAGVVYANVHSDRFPGGEIRGQLVRQ
jgi:hypothetical protein